MLRIVPGLGIVTLFETGEPNGVECHRLATTIAHLAVEMQTLRKVDLSLSIVGLMVTDKAELAQAFRFHIVQRGRTSQGDSLCKLLVG